MMSLRCGSVVFPARCDSPDPDHPGPIGSHPKRPTSRKTSRIKQRLWSRQPAQDSTQLPTPHEEEIWTEMYEHIEKHATLTRRKPSASQEERSQETKPADTLILDFQPPEL